MTSYRPLVIVNGDIERLPEGDTIEGSSQETSLGSFQNDTFSAVPLGTPVYCSASGKFSPAKADSRASARVFALVKDASIAGAASGNLQLMAFMTGTVSQWAVVTGDSAGLTPGANYYVSASVAGRLTKVPPAANGQWVVKVGQAITATVMAINISQPIGL